MAQAVNNSCVAFANGTIFICAKIVDLSGVVIASNDLASIQYSVYKVDVYGNHVREEIPHHVGIRLNVEDVFWDTVQTGNFNNKEVEYNFKWTIDNSVNECFPEANSRYIVRIDFMPVSGFISPIQIDVNTI